MTTCFIKISFRLLLLYSCLLTGPAIAQTKDAGKKDQPKGKANILSAGINIPLGDFSNTHVLGFGAEYFHSNHRFGSMKTKPVKAVGFIYSGGIDYYLGKKEKVSSYPYKYHGFTLLHGYGGVIYNPCKKGNISLITGPALGLSNGTAGFWWGVNLNGQYYFNEKFAIAPGLIFMKQHLADGIWSATLRGSMTF